MPDSMLTTFNLSYSDLMLFSNAIHQFMLRDVANFTLYNVDAAEIAAYKTQIEEYEDLPLDMQFEAELKQATQDKNAAIEAVKQVLRTVDMRAKILYTSEAGNYSKYHAKDMARLPDSELLMISDNIARLLVINAAAFLTVGWTAAMTTDLETKHDAAKAAIMKQLDIIADRDQATRVRVEKANALYAKMMLYCDIGKTIWYKVNDAYYNDYIIYPGGGSSIRPPAVLAYKFFEREYDWTSVSEADSYELQARFPEAPEFITIYSGGNTFYNTEIAQGTTTCRIRSIKEGLGESVWSEHYTFTNLPPAAPANLHLNTLSPDLKQNLIWTPVSGEVKYKIYHSSVAPGLPPGAWQLAGTVEGTNFTSAALSPGNRHYFKVQAFNGILESAASNFVFVEIPI